jgi:exopolysaccharide production protein ExoQ
MVVGQRHEGLGIAGGPLTRLSGTRLSGKFVKSDVVFAMAIIMASLLNWKIGMIVIIFPVALGCYIMARYHEMPGFLLRIWPILLLPGFALLSSLWSAKPTDSLYYGLQYFITVLCGLLIGAQTEQKSGLVGLFLGISLIKISSLVMGFLSGDILSALATDMNYLGFTGSKNAFSDMSAVFGMISISVFAIARATRSRSLSLLALASLVVAIFYVFKLGHSTGAIVGFLVGAAVIMLFATAGALPSKARLAMGVIVVLVAMVLITTSQFWYQSVLSDIMDIAGKDSTLTGRSYIWQRADVAIARNPDFGIGYSAFWQLGNLESEAIWRRMLIANRTGFNFHSTLYEIRVQLGWVGLLLFGVIAGIYSLILFIRNYQMPSTAASFYCAVIIYESARMPFESIATTSFNHSTLLMFAALGAAVAVKSAPPVVRSRQSGGLIGLTGSGVIARPRQNWPISSDV